MVRSIKKTAIPLSGYIYQNLVGLNVLCDWLDDPTLYRWVKFECDDEDRQFKGLDDLVAERSDGSMLLLQVKFTVDAYNTGNALSWAWLMQHKPKGRSLVQKWATAYVKAAAAGSVEAALVTNRRPDSELSECLSEDGKFIRIELVPEQIRAVLFEQLGEEIATRFFGEFEIRHSNSNDISLSRTTPDRYVPRHTSRQGWLALCNEAIEWALRRQSPPPDGRILLSSLRGVLDSKRPRPLDQNFRIPENYEPADPQFAKNFISCLLGGAKNTFVLWGSPGQGKSTFLSSACKDLDARNVPYVRHHYFMRLGDVEDRFSLSHVANSIMAQIEARHLEHVQGLSPNPEHLREWIQACARGYASENKRFVVVVDGLDHVWRENEGNKAPLDSLFQNLFPIPENAVLLIGSQKIDQKYLPKSFSKFVEADDWIELPRMSLACIGRWLAAQLHAQRFDLPAGEVRVEEAQITDLAKAFELMSGGHPLILTYCFEQLVREHRVLEPQLICKAPLQARGDIGKYYLSLWQGLSLPSKDALHLLADSGFTWPCNGLEDCLQIYAGELRQQVGHLLHISDAGVAAFHNSLLVFVMGIPDHQDVICRKLPALVQWLSEDAPDYHRWGWLWIYQARTGNPQPLLSLTTRVWAIDSLVKGYPRAQIEAILEAAEERAFAACDFPLAIRCRWLKTNVLNGPEFQTDDYQQLYQCALDLGEDDYPLRLVAMNLAAADEDELSMLGFQYLASERLDDAVQCQDQLMLRINDRLRANAYDEPEQTAAIKSLLHLIAKTGQYNVERLAESIVGSGDQAGDFLRVFTRRLSIKGDLRSQLALFQQPVLSESMRADIELEIVRMSGGYGASIHLWPEYQTFSHHPIIACWDRMYHGSGGSWLIAPEQKLELDEHRGYEERKALVEDHFHNLFFRILAESLRAKGAPVFRTPITYAKHDWLESAEDHLVKLANLAAPVIWRGEAPTFSFLYRLSEDIKRPQDFDGSAHYGAFQRALLSAACNLFLLCMPRSHLEYVPEADWDRVRCSPLFDFSDWLGRYLDYPLPRVADASVDKMLRTELSKMDDEISPFNSRVEKYLELCRLAIQQQSRGLAKELLRRALTCVIGYGWRKNSALRDTLATTAAVASVDKDYGRHAVGILGPIASRISAMTEKDAVNESDIAELILECCPEMFAGFYAHWLERSDWYNAEQTFGELIARTRLDGPVGELVMAAVWDSNAMTQLRRKNSAQESDVGSALVSNARRFGHPIETFASKRSSTRHDETDDVEVIVIDPEDYGPSDLPRLLEELGSTPFATRRCTLQNWFSSNVANGNSAAILRCLEPYIEQSDLMSEIPGLFDHAFLVSFKLEGKKAAYKWLVAAQIQCDGWSRYNDEPARKRFKHIAEYYRSEWRQFVLDSAKSRYGYGSGLLVPHRRLVELMLAVGEVSAAKAATDAMIASIVEDFSDQPLTVPSWLEEYVTGAL